MTLLDRYLYAVQSDLPKGQPGGDIIAEIGDDLQSQMEEREVALGRTLTEDEQAAIIKAYGHPRRIAARYAGAQYLIGPELLPFYWSTLRLVVTIVIAIELLGGAVSALVAHNGILFFDALYAAFHSLIWIFSIVTIAFALNERVPNNGNMNGNVIGTWMFRWDPRRLPEPGALPPVPRSSSLAEFIANFLALLVLLDAGGSHRIPLDTLLANALRNMHATLTPAWHPAYIGTIAGTALLALAAITVFVRPKLTALHEVVRAMSSAATMIGIALTLQAGPWIRPAGRPLNSIALYILVSAIVILGFQWTNSVRILLRKPSHHTPTQPRSMSATG